MLAILLLHGGRRWCGNAAWATSIYHFSYCFFFLLSGTVRTVTYDEHLCTLAGSRGFFMVLHL